MIKKKSHSPNIPEFLKAFSLSPNRIFLYWHIHEEKLLFICKYFSIDDFQIERALRIYEGTIVRNTFIHEVILPRNASKWTIKNVDEGKQYYMELGIKLKEDVFFPLLRSNSVGVELVGSQPVYCFPKPKWLANVSTYTYYEHLERGSNK